MCRFVDVVFLLLYGSVQIYEDISAKGSSLHLFSSSILFRSSSASSSKNKEEHCSYMSSVVVTQTLDWKLHAFDVLSEFNANNEASNNPMLQFEWLVGTQYKPMELTKSDWVSIRKSPPWAIDSWGLGCLIYELFCGAKLTRTEVLRNIASIPKSLLPDYQRLLSSTPSRRLNPSELIDNSVWWSYKECSSISLSRKSGSTYMRVLHEDWDLQIWFQLQISPS
ncbi:hypothetical protein ABZP36_029061 [Zizania latifolia]